MTRLPFAADDNFVHTTFIAAFSDHSFIYLTLTGRNRAVRAKLVRCKKKYRLAPDIGRRNRYETFFLIASDQGRNRRIMLNSVKTQ